MCLLLRPSPQGSDADHDHSSAIRAKVERFAQQAFARVPMASLPSVHVVGARLATAELPRLYAAADAFVLPSRCGTLVLARACFKARLHEGGACALGRGEGWGRPLVEAMSMGVPVIATNWSGHTLFVNDTTAWPVPLAGLACIDNVDAAGLYARHRWAEPSVAALRSIMRRHVEGQGLQDAEVARTRRLCLV